MTPVLLHTFLTGWMILAQDDTMGNFLRQARGLIVVTCVLGILWAVIFALSLQRGAERRRAEKLGQEPPPAFWIWVFQWLRQQFDTLSGTPRTTTPPLAAPAPPRPAPSQPDDPLAPDLDLLVGDLPEPDLADMLGDLPGDASADMFSARPAPVADAALADALESDFALDDDPAPADVERADVDAAEAAPEATFAPEPFDLSALPDAVAAAAGAAGTDLVALLRVFRDISAGDLIVDIEGQRFMSAVDLAHAGHTRRLTAVVRDLVALAKTAHAQSDADQAAAPPPTASPDMPGSTPPPPDAVELLYVFRDLTAGGLVIDMGDQRFTEVASLQAAGFGRRFTAVVRDLVQMAQAAQQAQPTAPPQSPAADESPDAPGQPAPRVVSTVLPDDELPSMAPGTMFRQIAGMAIGQKHDPPPVEPGRELSVAEEIDIVLQERLARTGEFAERTLKVEPSLSGGVRIQVDDQFYDGVGDITDDAIRTLLQEVVHEWEERK
ncbi:MAG: hypothetical protein K8S97_01525 [Anaerolineae bacterium]|nr:hypothetical protein [Anaerolineae bacterium]